MVARDAEPYLREIIVQADYCLVAVLAMNRHLKESNVPLFFREAQAFLVNAAALSRLLWPASNGARERGASLRALLSLPDEHPLRSRKLRDHLEHFDERLDRWLRETSGRNVVDFHIGPASVIGGAGIERRDFLRVFEPDRSVFTFRGEEFDIQLLATSVEELRSEAIARLESCRTDAPQGVI